MRSAELLFCSLWSRKKFGGKSYTLFFIEGVFSPSSEDIKKTSLSNWKRNIFREFCSFDSECLTSLRLGKAIIHYVWSFCVVVVLGSIFWLDGTRGKESLFEVRRIVFLPWGNLNLKQCGFFYHILHKVAAASVFGWDAFWRCLTFGFGIWNIFLAWYFPVEPRDIPPTLIKLIKAKLANLSVWR